MTTPLSNQTNGGSTACGRRREPRPWTLEDYQQLTASLLPRFGAKPMLCAVLNATGIDLESNINTIIATFEELSGDSEGVSWLRAVLAVLITIWGYVRKITASRLYRWVLKKFIIFSLLMIALESIIKTLIDLVEWSILQLELLKQIRDAVACNHEDNDNE